MGSRQQDDIEHGRCPRDATVGSRVLEPTGMAAVRGWPTGAMPPDAFEPAFRASPVALAVARDAHCRVVVRNAAMNRIVPASLDWQAWRLPDGSMPPVFDADGAPLALEQQPLRRAAFHGERTVGRLLELRWPGQAPLCLRISAEPLLDSDGMPCGAVASAIDVGGERDLARQVERADAGRRDADAAGRAKDALIGLFGHELRNPLNAIATAVEVLNRADPAAPEAQSARRIIGRQTRRLAQLLSELGEVGRSLGERLAPVPERLDLGALVRGCVARAAPRALARGQRVHTELAGIFVDADANCLEQALDHLLDETVCAAADGGAWTVRLREVGAEAVLELRELGAGEPLPATGAAIALDLPPADTHGLGVGLSTVLLRRLVEMHGGSVVVRHRDPATGGSVSLVRLPRVTSTPAAVRGARAEWVRTE